jgi:hypothetical protein
MSPVLGIVLPRAPNLEHRTSPPAVSRQQECLMCAFYEAAATDFFGSCGPTRPLAAWQCLLHCRSCQSVCTHTLLLNTCAQPDASLWQLLHLDLTLALSLLPDGKRTHQAAAAAAAAVLLEVRHRAAPACVAYPLLAGPQLTFSCTCLLCPSPDPSILSNCWAPRTQARYTF